MSQKVQGKPSESRPTTPNGSPGETLNNRSFSPTAGTRDPPENVPNTKPKGTGAGSSLKYPIKTSDEASPGTQRRDSNRSGTGSKNPEDSGAPRGGVRDDHKRQRSTDSVKSGHSTVKGDKTNENNPGETNKGGIFGRLFKGKENKDTANESQTGGKGGSTRTASPTGKADVPESRANGNHGPPGGESRTRMEPKRKPGETEAPIDKAPATTGLTYKERREKQMKDAREKAANFTKKRQERERGQHGKSRPGQDKIDRVEPKNGAEDGKDMRGNVGVNARTSDHTTQRRQPEKKGENPRAEAAKGPKRAAGVNQTGSEVQQDMNQNTPAKNKRGGHDEGIKGQRHGTERAGKVGQTTRKHTNGDQGYDSANDEYHSTQEYPDNANRQQARDGKRDHRDTHQPMHDSEIKWSGPLPKHEPGDKCGSCKKRKPRCPNCHFDLNWNLVKLLEQQHKGIHYREDS